MGASKWRWETGNRCRTLGILLAYRMYVHVVRL